MKLRLLAALGVAFLFTSCYTYGPGVTTVGVGVGYYDTLPRSWAHPYYHYNNRYYYGGNWEVGRFHHGGRYYDGRYRHGGRYFYGGHYFPHVGHLHHRRWH